MILKFLLRLFKSKKINSEDRVLILNALLEKIDALRISDIITYDLNGSILINRKSITIEQAILLKEGANSLDKNFAYRIIKEQIMWEAIKFGVHSSLSVETILFSKAAIWILEQEKLLISKITQNENLGE